MKVMESMLENRHCKIVTVNEMEFGIYARRGTTDAAFILRRL